jgi:hypothetical protein
VKGWLVAIGLAALVCYAGTRAGSILATKGELAKRVERDLNLVDDNSLATVRQDLVDEANRLGIELKATDIHIIYKDTTQETYPQRVLDKVAEFTNKRVEISLTYEAPILGFGWEQNVSASKIQQIRVRRAAPSREYEELLQ